MKALPVVKGNMPKEQLYSLGSVTEHGTVSLGQMDIIAIQRQDIPGSFISSYKETEKQCTFWYIETSI